MDQGGRDVGADEQTKGMHPSPLDHPIWAALATRQAHFALRSGPARRFPPDMAPFLAFDPDSPADPSAIDGLVAPGEKVYLVGPDPSPPPGLEVEGLFAVTQMVYARDPGGADDGEDYVVLGPDDVPDMLALTAIAYPAYFRARTIAMGTYLGVRHEGKLVAMAGQRLFPEGYRELSGICTHPDHRGRGHARRLVAVLVARILGEGLVPFLHVDADNAVARSAYERMGFASRRDLAMIRVRRP